MRNTYQDNKTTFPEWSTTLIQTTKAVLVIGLLVAITVAMARGVSGRIVGPGGGARGAVIPNASVTISNQDKGAITKVPTNGSGQYRADTLRAGNYQLKIEAPGLQTIVSNDNVVTVDNATVVDITMRPGSTSETVTVSSASPLIDTTSSSLGEVLNANDITSLPLNGRVFSQLVQTVPGSVAAGFGSAPEAAAGAGSSGSITSSVNQMPWGRTTYTLDGLNNIEFLNPFINLTPPLYSIQ